MYYNHFLFSFEHFLHYNVNLCLDLEVPVQRLQR